MVRNENRPLFGRTIYGVRIDSFVPSYACVYLLAILTMWDQDRPRLLVVPPLAPTAEQGNPSAMGISQSYIPKEPLGEIVVTPTEESSGCEWWH